ncbi:hypothetical protein AB0M97_23990 [Streptomyces sp. NPDC051207]|uniref:hypothetical protein n=1 Tax=Streptomyces sp. NPDC051207 TaxID=3154641 RepID=UPI0034125FE6
MTGESPVTGKAKTWGDGSPAIGFVSKLFFSVFVGDVVEFADKARRWGGWNWPPFLLVLALGTFALITAPDGPFRQFVWVYAAFGTAVALALARLLALASEVRGRRWRVLMSATAVICAVAGTIGMDHLAEHGEVDVTGRTRIIPGTATDGSRLRLVVDSPADRSRLRLTLTIRDAALDQQYCVPETEYTAELPGNANSRVEHVRSGQTVELALGGLRGEIEALITLATDENCRMNLSVADVVLHD